MKKTIFYIILSLKTTNGFEKFGQFYIGNKRKPAYDIFKKLYGEKEVDERNILLLELMETKD